MYAQGAEAQRRIFNAKYRLSGTRRKQSQSNDERAGRSLDSLVANNITQAISKKALSPPRQKAMSKRYIRRGASDNRYAEMMSCDKQLTPFVITIGQMIIVARNIWTYMTFLTCDVQLNLSFINANNDIEPRIRPSQMIPTTE